MLIAYELHDAPLIRAHGFPARLVIPYYYGTNSVKWFGRIELADRRSDSLFTTRYYNDPDRVPGDGTTQLVWSLAPESLIVFPGPKAILEVEPVEIHGWAWSDCPAELVEVSTDAGRTWQAVSLPPMALRGSALPICGRPLRWASTVCAAG